MPGFFFIIGLSWEFPGKFSMEARLPVYLHSSDRKNIFDVILKSINTIALKNKFKW
jgi:hypothetical protein